MRRRAPRGPQRPAHGQQRHRGQAPVQQALPQGRCGLAFAAARVGLGLGVLVQPVAQFARQLARRARALVRVLDHGVRANRRQRGRNFRVDLVRERRLVVQHRVGDLLQRLALEGAPLREQLVQHDAEREHIGAAIGRVLPQLLGRHVQRRAGDRVVGQRIVLIGHARDAEVEHARLRAADHEDVGRLDVAMHHALVVRIGQRIGDAAHDQRGLRRRGAPAVLLQLPQVAALEQLHRDVHALLGQPGIEHGDDVRMAQARGSARLVEQPGIDRFALLLGHCQVQRLDRDGARQQRVVRGVHRAEASLAELVLQRIAPDVADGRPKLDGALGVARVEGCGRPVGEVNVGVFPRQARLFGDRGRVHRFAWRLGRRWQGGERIHGGQLSAAACR